MRSATGTKSLQVHFDPLAGTVTVTLNAGEATFDGFEAELSAVPVRGLTLNLGVSYVDPQYQRYLFNGVDRSDDAAFPMVSNWNVNTGFTYAAPVAFGTFTMSGNYSYKSGTVFEPLDSSSALPNARDLLGEGSQHDVSASISLSDINVGNAQLTLTLFGRNLLNNHYRNFSVDFGQLGQGTVNYNRPRVIGIEGRISF